jgi:hypothetical protein
MSTCVEQRARVCSVGTYREFKNQFIDPIRGGQHKDSNIYAVQLMKRRAFALHERLKHCTHR